MAEYVLLGSPVAHSLSPVFQNAGFESAGLDCRYGVRDVGAAELVAYADAVRRGELLGANVTIPHKAAAAGLADERSERVCILNAANTWWRRDDGTLCAENTDVDGVVGSLAILNPARRSTAVILGAGGASAAAALACAREFERVVIVNRTRARATALALRLHERTSDRAAFAALAWHDARGVKEAFGEADVLIHGTSIGIKGDAGMLDTLPWRTLSPLCAVLDLVYSPDTTPTLERARSNGLRARDGLEMLLIQGIAAQRRWLGREPDTAAMRDALAAATRRDSNALQIPPAMPTANTNP